MFSKRLIEPPKGKKATKTEDVVISVCGMAGSGKSTQARKLAEKYCLKFFSGGDALKALALKEGFKPLNYGWWESREGMRFLKVRSVDQKYDKKVDEMLLEVADEGNVVLDSWTMPWLLKRGFKIWLEASAEKRAERIAQRDRMPVVNALKALKAKEKRTKMIYKRLYGFKLGEDFEPFHFILDTESLSSDEVFHVLCSVIDNTVLRSTVS